MPEVMELHRISGDVDYMLKVIVPDMPMKFDHMKLFKFEQPLFFDRDGITRFGIFNIDKLNKPDWYYFDENFYVFHFSRAYETEHEYVIYACLNKNKK